jgi:hypothetical protein
VPRPPRIPPSPESAARDLARATEDRKSVLLRSVEADLEGAELDVWEARFCRWLALQGNVKRSKQVEVASLLAGTQVSTGDLIALRCRPAWKALWVKERDVESALKKARADLSRLFDDLGGNYRKMLTRAVVDNDVRAATGLLTPLLDRAMPKREDGPTVVPDVHIHLSVQQAKGLESAPLDVSAEEVTVAEYTVEDVA